jgi:hypothetical protein
LTIQFGASDLDLSKIQIGGDTMFEAIQKKYELARIVHDEANSQNSLKFTKYGTVVDTVCVAIKIKDIIEIYDDQGIMIDLITLQSERRM